jgi:AraC family L-rhamnose operon regulatory protein RhaS
MELITIGQKHHPGKEVSLWHNAREIFDPQLGVGTHFRLILVESGTGILRINDQHIVFNAPVLICLNEQETLSLEQNVNIKATALYFHPGVINDAFSFEKIREDYTSFTPTDWQDRIWLDPFINRSANQSGLLNLGPVTANQITQQIAYTARELNQQRDIFWPCRSRSYFLELLFTIDRLYREPELTEMGVLSQLENQKEIGEVLLYLHTHYQEKINLNELARQFHTNRTTLTRQFRTVTGQSVMNYLVNLRIHLASLMLRNTTVPVAEVMQRVGFMDDTHFTRTFRKHINTTPSEYRQLNCWMLQ